MSKIGRLKCRVMRSSALISRVLGEICTSCVMLGQILGWGSVPVVNPGDGILPGVLCTATYRLLFFCGLSYSSLSPTLMSSPLPEPQKWCRPHTADHKSGFDSPPPPPEKWSRPGAGARKVVSTGRPGPQIWFRPAPGATKVVSTGTLRHKSGCRPAPGGTTLASSRIGGIQRPQSGFQPADPHQT